MKARCERSIHCPERTTAPSLPLIQTSAADSTALIPRRHTAQGLTLANWTACAECTPTRPQLQYFLQKIDLTALSAMTLQENLSYVAQSDGLGAFGRSDFDLDVRQAG